MNETEFNWDDLKLFLAIARTGVLNTASDLTGKSPPTLGRRMFELERSLGLELFHRRPRGYDLTEAGQELLEKACKIEAHVFDLADNDTPPLVKISAGTWVTRILIDRVDEVTGQTPVRLRFINAEEVLDIGRREAAIGIRNRRPGGTGLAGRKIGRVRFAVYASDSGVTKWAHVRAKTPSAIWVKNNIEHAHAIEVTSPQNALDLAVAGFARAVLPTFIGDREPSLQRISESIEELEHEQWLVTHHEDRFLPEVRQVIDRTFSILKEVSTID
ncbi:MAG: LysR family transcriptional regulator [Pseudomonadota bacterium]